MIRQRALKNESRFSRTYVVCEDKRVVAYFSISAGAVERAAAPGKVRRNAPGTIPVSVIGRLAVSRDVLARTLITAPIAGTVVELRFRTEGGVIRPGDPMEFASVKVDFKLPELFLPSVNVGQTVDVIVDALPGRTFSVSRKPRGFWFPRASVLYWKPSSV